MYAKQWHVAGRRTLSKSWYHQHQHCKLKVSSMNKDCKIKGEVKEEANASNNKRKLETSVRRSGRSVRKVNYSESIDAKFLDDDTAPSSSTKRTPTYTPPTSCPNSFLSAYDIEDHKYKRDSKNRLYFKDEPDFRPSLTPKQMIHSGIFGGCYFNPSGKCSLCVCFPMTPY